MTDEEFIDVLIARGKERLKACYHGLELFRAVLVKITNRHPAERDLAIRTIRRVNAILQEATDD